MTNNKRDFHKLDLHTLIEDMRDAEEDNEEISDVRRHIRRRLMRPNELVPEIVVNVAVNIDESMLSDGFASFDIESTTFTITIPPHVEIVEINTTQVLAHVAAGKTQFASIDDYPDIFSIRIDDIQKPSCRFYSPTKKEIDNGATQVANYPYNRPRTVASCCNPLVSGAKDAFVPCNYPLSHNQCPYSEFESWKDLVVAYNEDVPQLSIRRSLFANAMPYYQLYDCVNNDIVIDKTPEFIQVKKPFDAAVEADSLYVKNAEREKRSYFKAVLA